MMSLLPPRLDPFNFPQQEAWRDRHLLRRAQRRLIRSGQTILGPGVAAFEAAFATWLDRDLSPEHVVGVASGTDALELALRACGVEAGDRVALPAHTAYATLAAVLRLQARPVFVDLAPTGAVLCPDHLQTLLSQAVEPIRAVIAVHLYGEVCDLTTLVALCDRYGTSLIEDCAQACGSRHGTKSVGLQGRFACFSFYPTKNLAALGDGGAVLVNRRDDVTTLRRLRFYGWNGEREAVQMGVNSRLDELQAWLLRDKLPQLNRRLAQRRQVAQWYRQALEGLPALQLPHDGEHGRHSYHLYVVRLPAAIRDQALGACRGAGLPVGLHYPLACHQHTHVIQRFGRSWSLPRTEALLPTILSLPLHPDLPRREVRRLAAVLEPLLAQGH